MERTIRGATFGLSILILGTVLCINYLSPGQPWMANAGPLPELFVQQKSLGAPRIVVENDSPWPLQAWVASSVLGTWREFFASRESLANVALYLDPGATDSLELPPGKFKVKAKHLGKNLPSLDYAGEVNILPGTENHLRFGGVEGPPVVK